MDAFHFAIDRETVGMDIEHIHEYADFQCFTLSVDILRFFDHYDASVCGRYDGIADIGNRPRRITEKLKDKQTDQP